MPQFDWSQKVIMKLWHSLPEKYIDGSFIENRIIQDEFTMEDINKNAYYMRDILRSYISWAIKGVRHNKIFINKSIRIYKY